jgi:YHS domain-containing protein
MSIWMGDYLRQGRNIYSLNGPLLIKKIKNIMMYKKMIAAILCAQVLLSCAENKQQNIPAAVMQKADTIATPSFKEVVFDSKKDLVCGMPVSAGVSDTAHYEGKVYGFCAKECKDEFVKSPKTYLTAK